MVDFEVLKGGKALRDELFSKERFNYRKGNFVLLKKMYVELETGAY